MPEMMEVSACEVAMTTEVRTMPGDAPGPVAAKVTAKMTGAEVAAAVAAATMAAASPGKSISRNRSTAERENRNQRKD
jgi:hypothetical protein